MHLPGGGLLPLVVGEGERVQHVKRGHGVHHEQPVVRQRLGRRGRGEGEGRGGGGERERM